MKYVRACARGGTCSFSFRARVLIPGCWNAAMGRPAAFTTNHMGIAAVDKAILSGGQYCLNAMLNHGGFSAYGMPFGSDPVDLYSRQKNDA